LKVIEIATSSTTVKHLSHGDIEDIKMPIPHIDEQTAIAAILSDMDAEIAALEQKRDKTRALKQGMMQELLTGKTRLI
jgi:type I restriction enzyme S subunit